MIPIPDFAAAWPEDIPSNIPASIVAAAMARACYAFVRSRPQLAHNVLRNQFEKLQPVLVTALDGDPSKYSVACASAFLYAYFEDEGDWRKMEQTLISISPCDSALTERTVAYLAQMYRKAADAVPRDMTGEGDEP